MNKKDIQDFEINQLLEAINFRYGYDFRNYARASLERRIKHRVELSGLDSIAAMTAKILHNPGFFDVFLKDISITVTQMFRDPEVFAKLREIVSNKLCTYSRINIWHAGCATGEEVYSMAILLKEAGLSKKIQIYATDFNNHSLEIAKKGIYPAEKIKQFTKNYLASGGKASFSDYYQAKYESAKMEESLKNKITFANHNLMKDKLFAEMHLILCRNVLIYFDKVLQNRVLDILRESLIHRGFLVLGNKETIDFTSVKEAFETYSKNERIYRKKLNV